METTNVLSKKQQVDKQKTTNMVKLMLHGEGLVLLAAALGAYAWLGFNGWVLLATFLAPDLVFIVWMVNRQIGTVAYNAVHNMMVPVVVLVISIVTGFEPGIQAALIWLGHIGMDRMVGYGLKYQSEFKDTHLNRV